MWWMTLVLVAGATGIAGYQQFNIHDESDYVDNLDDDEPPVIRKPANAADFVTRTAPAEKQVQGEIEKLLGQSVIHYEEPKLPGLPIVHYADRPTAPPPSSRARPDDIYLPESSSKGPISKVETRSTERSRRTIRLKSIKRLTSELVYSVYVPSRDVPAIGQKMQPGVIESIVGAHDVVRYEPRRGAAPAPAHNRGGTRPRSGTGRRYLVDIPTNLSQRSSRLHRPTPTTMMTRTFKMYTRRTHRHPNCTDSYYDCLKKCFNGKGYRVRCPWETTPKRQEPARINMTALLWAVQSPLDDYDTSNLIKKFQDWLVEKQYRTCKSWTTRTTTTPKVYPIYYDDMLSPQTGTIMAKCWVCGLHDTGVPANANCADNFGDLGLNAQLSEKNSYRRYCRYMDEVPLWFNRSDPFSVFGKWTGGCSHRWLDLSGLYTQRACRSRIHPAVGQHFLSRRMARLELSLRDVSNGCVVSPMATLVPFSRAVSLYARFHVCVCSSNFCNRATRGRAPASAAFLFALLSIRL